MPRELTLKRGGHNGHYLDNNDRRSGAQGGSGAKTSEKQLAAAGNSGGYLRPTSGADGRDVYENINTSEYYHKGD